MPQVLLSVREKAGSARPVSRLDAKIILPLISLRYNSPEAHRSPCKGAAGRCPLPLSALKAWPIRGRSEGHRPPPIPGRFSIFRANRCRRPPPRPALKNANYRGRGVHVPIKGRAAAADRMQKELI